jgi:c-di-GMP-related signal transduction protein
MPQAIVDVLEINFEMEQLCLENIINTNVKQSPELYLVCITHRLLSLFQDLQAKTVNMAISLFKAFHQSIYLEFIALIEFLKIDTHAYEENYRNRQQAINSHQ